MIAAGCGCCGAAQLGPGVESLCEWPDGLIRCGKHYDRNPCAVEGCRRTRAAPTDGDGFPCVADDQFICADHWRRYVPPGSRVRRAYLAFHRQAKRHGWGWKGKRGQSARLDWRYRRFWDQLVAMIRRRSTEGHIDEAAISQLMGWD